MIRAFIFLFLGSQFQPDENRGDFRDMKGFVGGIFQYLFAIVGIAACVIIVAYIIYVLWRDRKTRPLSVKVKDYINDCRTFWNSKQVKDAVRDVGRDLFITVLVFVAIGIGIYAYCNWH